MKCSVPMWMNGCPAGTCGNDAKDDGEYDWICCEDRFLIDGHDTHLIRGWLPLCYFEGFV